MLPQTVCCRIETEASLQQQRPTLGSFPARRGQAIRLSLTGQKRRLPSSLLSCSSAPLRSLCSPVARPQPQLFGPTARIPAGVLCSWKANMAAQSDVTRHGEKMAQRFRRALVSPPCSLTSAERRNAQIRIRGPISTGGSPRRGRPRRTAWARSRRRRRTGQGPELRAGRKRACRHSAAPRPSSEQEGREQPSSCAPGAP